jgi:hypothetical protein
MVLVLCGFALMVVEQLKGATRRVEYVGATLPGGMPDEYRARSVAMGPTR